MPTPRFSLAVAPTAQGLSAMGGGAFRNGAFENFDLIETYDPEKGRWRKETGFRLPWPSAGLGVCVADGVLVVMGGNDGARIQDRVARYEATTGTWVECPPMNEPRAAMGTARIGSQIYALGGRGADGRHPVDSLESLTL